MKLSRVCLVDVLDKMEPFDLSLKVMYGCGGKYDFASKEITKMLQFHHDSGAMIVLETVPMIQYQLLLLRFGALYRACFRVLLRQITNLFHFTPSMVTQSVC